jgi:peptidoglycan lytic transglycosylase G
VSRLLKVLLTLVVLGAVALIGGGLWVNSQINPGGGGQEVIVTVPPGASTSRIASILDQRKVIKNSSLFKLYVRFRGKGPFEAGDYTLRQHESFSDIVATLGKGPKVSFKRLTIPEGFTLQQIADKVGQLPGRSATAFLAAATSGAVHSKYQPAGSTNLEGLLFPDTYFIDPKDDETAILRRMVTEFDQVAAEAGYDNAAPSGVTAYQAIITASLVESESKIDADRPKIAQVIYNRLQKGIPLQIDATVIYARGGAHRENGQVLNSDLQVDSPYNTYKVKGLPPTPIAAAGRASLRAALATEAGPWLYYVKFEADGTHKFATTLDEQNRNAADARRRGVIP